MIVKALGVSVLTFLMLEASFRLYDRVRPSYVFPKEKMTDGVRGKPFDNVYGYPLNSRGFKDKEFKEEKAAGIRRILGIGDSFVFGVVPYPQNFLTILEEKLNSGGERFEVLNMGISGTGPPEYLSLLKNEGLGLKPDMVIVFFYLGNDAGSLKYKDEGPSVRKWEGGRSYVLAFLNYAYRLFKGYFVLSVFNKRYSDTTPSMKARQYLQYVALNSIKYTLSPDGSPIMLKRPDINGLFMVSMNNLFMIKRFCDSNGIELLVVLLPEEIQINRNLQSRVVSGLRDKPRFDFKIPNRLISHDLRKTGIRFLDLTEDFSRHYESRKVGLYKPNDTHWNIAGNRLAAELLYPHLMAPSGQKPGD